jgi:hypothetical protein
MQMQVPVLSGEDGYTNPKTVEQAFPRPLSLVVPGREKTVAEPLQPIVKSAARLRQKLGQLVGDMLTIFDEDGA